MLDELTFGEEQQRLIKVKAGVKREKKTLLGSDVLRVASFFFLAVLIASSPLSC